MGRTPSLVASDDSTITSASTAVVPPSSVQSPSNEETVAKDASAPTVPTTTSTSKRMIDASGEIRHSHSKEVQEFMKSIEAQDNVNILEQLTAQEPTRVTVPGAVLVRTTAQSKDDQEEKESSARIDRRHINDDGDISPPEEENNGTPPILVARLARDEEDIRAMYQQQLETEVERMRQELVTDATIVVADEVKTPDAPPNRRRCIVGVLILVVLGAGLGGIVYWVLQDNKTQKGQQQQQQLDPLLEELRSLIAPTEEDLLPFSNPVSAQSKALAWLHDDPITNTPDRSTETVLERYVLAVFKYSTSGWTSPFLSSEPVCRWNAMFCTNGVVTALDLYSASIFDLSGTFPWELVLLTNLITLDFSFGKISGEIPTRINELTNLEILWLEHNRFSGPLLSDLPESLIGLYLHANQFTGTMPDVWGTSLTNLKEFLIYENQLTGTIPSSIGEISSLIRFEFGSNNFTGSVDSFLCTGRDWVELIADCDEVVCTCCTICNP